MRQSRPKIQTPLQIPTDSQAARQNSHTSLIANLYASITPSLICSGTSFRMAATESLTSGTSAGSRLGACVASFFGRRFEKMEVEMEMPQMRPTKEVKFERAMAREMRFGACRSSTWRAMKTLGWWDEKEGRESVRLRRVDEARGLGELAYF